MPLNNFAKLLMSVISLYLHASEESPFSNTVIGMPFDNFSVSTVTAFKIQ